MFEAFQGDAPFSNPEPVIVSPVARGTQAPQFRMRVAGIMQTHMGGMHPDPVELPGPFAGAPATVADLAPLTTPSRLFFGTPCQPFPVGRVEMPTGPHHADTSRS